MADKLLQELSTQMDKSIDALHKELNRVRTGRASLSLLDGIKVDYYGTVTPLNQVATLSIPESRLITIQPWDTAIIGDIEKAIQKSELGLRHMIISCWISLHTISSIQLKKPEPKSSAPSRCRPWSINIVFWDLRISTRNLVNSLRWERINGFWIYWSQPSKPWMLWWNSIFLPEWM